MNNNRVIVSELQDNIDRILILLYDMQEFNMAVIGNYDVSHNANSDQFEICAHGDDTVLDVSYGVVECCNLLIKLNGYNSNIN